jgi:arylformamidase
MSEAIYRGMDRAALDAAYNNGAAVADRADWIARWKEKSAQIRAEKGARLDVAYGPRPRERLDYLPSGKANAPLLAFIHGGYWQSNDKDMFAFVSEGPRARGINVAMIGYMLAPDVRLTDIVAEMHQALSYLDRHAADFGFDRQKIFVAGWSAGGHLTATAASHPSVRGGIPISGIFDLEPISLNYLNEKLSLSADEIANLSPLRTLGNRSPPLWVTAGANELPELRRQSREFAAAGIARGLPFRHRELPGHHHFSILDEIAKPDGSITTMLADLIATAK